MSGERKTQTPLPAAKSASSAAAPRSIILRHLKRIAVFAFALYVGFCFFVYSAGDVLIFHPQPSTYSKSVMILMIPSTGGNQVAAVHLKAPNSKRVILVSHGNAEDIGDLTAMLSGFQSSGISVFAYDYPGYGLSTGKPTVQGAYDSADAAYSYLTGKLGYKSTDIIALGRSVGGGPAFYLAEKHNLCGLIAESTFTSAPRVVTKFRIFPFDIFPNIDRLKNIRCPVFVMHGQNDEVIPPEHGERLYAAANEPKFIMRVKDAGHNDMFYKIGNAYFNAVKYFIDSIGPDGKVTPPGQTRKAAD